mmetsp:Transcript_107361/g.309072  ORF Transcript_107361/g.309072 Transcript_107361/m.309072 type:complete len:300 (-) Transcript_107361:836-1735(-)
MSYLLIVNTSATGSPTRLTGYGSLCETCLSPKYWYAQMVPIRKRTFFEGGPCFVFPEETLACSTPSLTKGPLPFLFSLLRFFLLMWRSWLVSSFDRYSATLRRAAETSNICCTCRFPESSSCSKFAACSAPPTLKVRSTRAWPNAVRRRVQITCPGERRNLRSTKDVTATMPTPELVCVIGVLPPPRTCFTTFGLAHQGLFSPGPRLSACIALDKFVASCRVACSAAFWPQRSSSFGPNAAARLADVLGRVARWLPSASRRSSGSTRRSMASCPLRTKVIPSTGSPCRARSSPPDKLRS